MVRYTSENSVDLSGPHHSSRLRHDQDGLRGPVRPWHRPLPLPHRGSRLLELLPRLLPTTNDDVSSLINMVRMESNNGYDLLWRILELTVPGFDPTFPVKIPTWSDDGFFKFAHAF